MKKGEGKTYFDEHLKGSVQHRMDLWEVFVASPADAFNICREKADEQLDLLLPGGSRHRPTVHVGGSPCVVSVVRSELEVECFFAGGALAFSL